MDLAQARRHSVLCEFIRPYQSHEDVGGFDAEAMADRIVRLERILHALREPSESIMHTAYLASFQHTLFDRAWAATLCAAVVAAEQEVGRE